MFEMTRSCVKFEIRKITGVQKMKSLLIIIGMIIILLNYKSTAYGNISDNNIPHIQNTYN